tara:strand:+ start:15769 stop:17490 length:1722 start_codon:yes stop_codon:yes gene_type:complete
MDNPTSNEYRILTCNERSSDDGSTLITGIYEWDLINGSLLNRIILDTDHIPLPTFTVTNCIYVPSSIGNLICVGISNELCIYKAESTPGFLGSPSPGATEPIKKIPFISDIKKILYNTDSDDNGYIIVGYNGMPDEDIDEEMDDDEISVEAAGKIEYLNVKSILSDDVRNAIKLILYCEGNLILEMCVGTKIKYLFSSSKTIVGIDDNDYDIYYELYDIENTDDLSAPLQLDDAELGEISSSILSDDGTKLIIGTNQNHILIYSTEFVKRNHPHNTAVEYYYESLAELYRITDAHGESILSFDTFENKFFLSSSSDGFIKEWEIEKLSSNTPADDTMTQIRLMIASEDVTGTLDRDNVDGYQTFENVKYVGRGNHIVSILTNDNEVRSVICVWNRLSIDDEKRCALSYVVDLMAFPSYIKSIAMYPVSYKEKRDADSRDLLDVGRELVVSEIRPGSKLLDVENVLEKLNELIGVAPEGVIKATLESSRDVIVAEAERIRSVESKVSRTNTVALQSVLGNRSLVPQISNFMYPESPEGRAEKRRRMGHIAELAPRLPSIDEGIVPPPVPAPMDE